jgi:hypothetical protein
MAYTTINKSSDYFNTKLYTANNTGQSITGLNFQPDWTWIKSRDNTEKHTLQNVITGTGYELTTQDGSAQNPTTTSITSFNSDGFTVGSADNVNDGSLNYVSWNWKANGTGVSNTDGSITSTVSANTTSGFSIVKWTGSGGNATIGTGLNAVPKMIIVKSLANATSWMVYHSAIGNNSEIYLNGTNANAGSSTAWQDTDPTSSVFYVGGGAGDGVNASGDYIAYCFADVQGFSKVGGSYIGNGNADGAFIYTGFKPAMIFLKNASDGAKNWEIIDNRRPSTGQNPADDILFPDTSDAEASSQTDRLVDFVSNGVKIRGNSGQLNGNGNTFIFACFAEAPLVGSNNVPANAR